MCNRDVGGDKYIRPLKRGGAVPGCQSVVPAAGIGSLIDDIQPLCPSGVRCRSLSPSPTRRPGLTGQQQKDHDCSCLFLLRGLPTYLCLILRFHLREGVRHLAPRPHLWRVIKESALFSSGLICVAGETRGSYSSSGPSSLQTSPAPLCPGSLSALKKDPGS